MPALRRVPTTRLAADLAALQLRVGYLDASALAAADRRGAGPEAGALPAGAAGWIPAAAFLEPGGILATLLGPDRTGRFAKDRRVAASSFFQGAALRVLGTGIAMWMTTGLFPDVAAGATAIALHVDLPARIALRGGSHDGSGPEDEVTMHEVGTDPTWFVARAFGGHLDPLAEAVRNEIQIGERLLWGNAAAAVAGVILDLERSAPPAERAGLRASARHLLGLLPHDLTETGEWADITVGTHTETFWTRRTCCLWYLEDPGRSLCDTCNLLSPEERHTRLVRQTVRRAPTGP